MTTAIYARYSSDLQDARSTEDQIARLRTQIERDGKSFSSELVFTDAAESGAKWERPGLQAMLSAVTRGDVKTVYVESVDRLSRDMGDASRIRKRLEFNGVRLRSIGDGIELDGRGSSSLAFDVKTLISEMYLKDLGDKTLRGLQGRARAGKSTGGRTYGYVTDGESAVVIEPAEAETVRRVFACFVNGMSCEAIAKLLNAEAVAPPRPHSRRRGEGWMSSCLREMLRNRRYIGDFSFGRLKWRKDPESRRRVPMKRDEDEIITLLNPDLRIVDDETWELVQDRNARSLARYHEGTGHAVRRPTQYLLSTLLVCHQCGSPMEIAGGGPGRAVYRCYANRKRGNCDNALSVRESVARGRILESICQTLTAPGSVSHIRTRYAERMREHDLGRTRVEAEARSRIDQGERRVRNFILMQADADRSPQVADMRREAERALESDRRMLGNPFVADIRNPLANPRAEFKGTRFGGTFRPHGRG